MVAVRGRNILLGFVLVLGANAFKLQAHGSPGASSAGKATNISLLSQPQSNRTESPANASISSGGEEAKRRQIVAEGRTEPGNKGQQPRNGTQNATSKEGGSFGFDVSKMSVSEFWEPYMWVVAAIVAVFAVSFELCHRRLADVDLTATPDCGAEHHEHQMLHLFNGILPLVRPFYFGHERRTAWTYLAAISVLGVIDLILGLVIMVWSKEFWDTIEKKNISRFFPLILDLCLLAFSKIILSTYGQYIGLMLSIRWRRSMTQWLLTQWLKDKCFYAMQLDGKGDVPDNPDQRIQEDARLFVEQTMSLGTGFVTAATHLLSRLPMLLLLSPSYAFGWFYCPGWLLYVTLIYSGVGAVVAHFVGQKLILINFGLQKYEAGFRYDIVQIRDNAESIALYGSEPCEEERLQAKFAWIERVWWMMMCYTKRLGFFVKAFSCTANPCTVLTVANALQSGCKEGPDTGAAVIESGLVCTTQCKDGYYRSDDVLRCYAQTLTPATFTCEAPCPVPTVQNAAQTGVCKEASDKILPFTSCTTQCAPGYTPSVTSMSCRNAVFSPATVVCNPDPCPAPTGVEFAHRKGPCQEGPLITSGSACTTQCLAGYTPSVATLSCTAATFTPATFTCVPNPCAIPEIEQAAGNGCRGIRMGQKVDSGKACVAVCKPGWSPNIKKLDCYAEKLTPSTFACEPDPCPIPFAKNQEGSGCLGVPGRVDGTVIESGETCRTECKEGYHASVERMSCMTGSLTPPSWSCIEDRCPAEGGVANAGARICEEGNSIESGKLCTTKCNSGYTPNHASLQCRLGKLSPHTFVCNPNPCAVPGVANRLGSGCSGLPHPAMVDHGTTCMTQCEDGYTPTVAELRCAAGTLAPTTFSCSENPCDAPDGIQNGANQLCREGRTLQSGSLCTTQCADGYTPSVASLSCSLGKLSPRTFSCNPLPCNTPRVDNRQGNGCKGKRGNTIDSGATCTPQCRAGFTPSESELRCAATVLTPATFTCNPNPCAIPTVNKALGNGCNGVSGGMIDSGSKCQAACMPGYTPSVAQLGCFASVFIPASFTCRPDSCAFPSVQYKSGSGCAGVGGTTMSSGATCTTQCASGYTPDVGELKCFAGVFTPSSFECLPSPCNLPSVANAQGNGCKGKVGTVMASGGVCKTDCMPGFEPSAAQLQCTAGRLSPTSFSCDELRCRAPTGLANAPSVGCAEGSRVRGGASCTPRCNAGYTPTVASLACKQGVFDPTTYACQPQGCSIPGVANAKNPRCAEGNNIAHGQRCTPECNDGFVASQSALSCMAGSLTPSSFSCLAPCTAPSVADSHQSGFCREGNRISHGGSCTAQCKAGFSATRGSLECNNGRLQGTASCQIEMPAMGASFYNCWSGDPHFTCRNGRRSDPLVPGTHWVLKQSCPNSPNFMWIQGLYGPVSPSGAFGVAFGGMFLSKNVLTVRASNNPPWIVKWNDRNIQNSWTGSGGSWRYNLAGTNLVVSWNNRRIEVGLSYGVTYKANRHHWNRQNWRISGVFYNDWYTSNSLWSRLCRSGSYGGEAIDLPEPRWRWHPRGDDRMVSSAYDLFQRSRAEIEGRLNSLSSMASLFAEEEILQVNLSTVEEPKLCEGKALEEAKKSCAVLKKEGTEEEEEEIQEDEEAKDNQEQTYQACLADACMTHEKNFGDAGKETEEESEMESALKHKKELRVVAADGECKEGWQPTDPSENILSDEEKSRAEKRKNDCQVACKLCRPKRRRYLVGPLSLHNETRDACIAQRLAMPKNTEDVKRLWELQKEHCTADKGWLGGVYKEGGWKWDDGAFVAGIGSVTGSNGDYLCIDKEDGTLVNCEHRADTKHDALCEGVWY